MTDLDLAVDEVTTVELDPDEPVDLIEFAGADGYVFEQEGHGLAGRGVACRIDLEGGVAGDLSLVQEVLAALSGAVALGALPFDRHEPASLVVPIDLVRRDADGRQWRTTIG